MAQIGINGVTYYSKDEVVDTLELAESAYYRRGIEVGQKKILEHWCRMRCNSDGSGCRGTKEECYESIMLRREEQNNEQ